MYCFLLIKLFKKIISVKGEISMNKARKVPVLETNSYGFEGTSDALFVGIGLLLLCLFLFGGLF
jgi:hypothetical protein